MGRDGVGEGGKGAGFASGESQSANIRSTARPLQAQPTVETNQSALTGRGGLTASFLPAWLRCRLAKRQTCRVSKREAPSPLPYAE